MEICKNYLIIEYAFKFKEIPKGFKIPKNLNLMKFQKFQNNQYLNFFKKEYALNILHLIYIKC